MDEERESSGIFRFAKQGVEDLYLTDPLKYRYLFPQYAKGRNERGVEGDAAP